MYQNFQSLDDAFRAIKELQVWQQYMDTKNLDFHQRQIKNAHPSIDDYDYVVRKELRDRIDQIDVNQTGGGDGGSAQGNNYVRTFGYAIGSNLAVGTDLLPPLIIPFASTTLIKLFAKVKVAPTGAAIIADINVGGTTILNASKVTIPAGSTAVLTVSSFATPTFTEGQVITFDIDQVGSTVPGGTLVVTMRFRIN